MIRVFRIPDMIPIDNGGIEVFVGDSLRDPMGIGLFKDPTNGLVYAIVGRKTGPENGYLWQYLLQTDTFGIVNATLVRKFGQFTGGKEIESIVVDDELGYVYYSNETVGVRQYYASPDKGDNELSLFATHLVTEDHEGISIYKTGPGTGYILLSDQQSNRFHIFQREGSLENPYYHALRKIVTVEAVESDGSDITEVPLNENFKQGLFVAMSTDQTFHYYRWEDIAGKDLLISK
jgi:3-phytase